jgi:hypothetical protein
MTGNPGKGGAIEKYELTYNDHDPIAINSDAAGEGKTHHTFGHKDTWVEAAMVYKSAGSSKRHTTECTGAKNIHIPLP